MAQNDWGTRYHLSGLSGLDDPSGRMVKFAEVLSEENPLLRDLAIYPSNEILSHTDVRETSLPTPVIIKVGEGWDASKAEWDPFTETLSMFKDRIDVPRDVLRIQRNATAKRKKIRSRHQEGFGQAVSNHIYYGSDATAPEKFPGLDVRYSVPDASSAKNPTNGHYGVYDAGGTGSDTSSIWLVQIAEDKAFGLCPAENTMRGINTFDMGLRYATAENSKQTLVYREELEWDLGLCIFDYRAVARVRNIESAISSLASNTNLWQQVIEARNNMKGSDPVFMYCAGNVHTQLDIMAVQKANVQYSDKNVWGKRLLMFRDMVISRDDSISEAETAVAAA